MLYAGLPMEGWEKYIYDSLDEITDPNKAMVQWVSRFKRNGGGDVAVENGNL